MSPLAIDANGPRHDDDSAVERVADRCSQLAVAQHTGGRPAMAAVLRGLGRDLPVRALAIAVETALIGADALKFLDTRGRSRLSITIGYQSSYGRHAVHRRNHGGRGISGRGRPRSPREGGEGRRRFDRPDASDAGLGPDPRRPAAKHCCSTRRADMTASLLHSLSLLASYSP